MYTNLIEKIKRSFENYLNVTDFEGVYVGSDSFENFYNHYEFTNFLESFLGQTYGELHKADTLFIIGSVNLNQVEKLKKMYEQLSGKRKYVIHLQGSVKDDMIEKSYFTLKDINSVIPIDLTYRKYPFDLEEITTLVKELKER